MQLLGITKQTLLLFILFSAALGIRILGIHPGYLDTHPDEPATYSTAIHMFYNSLKPDHFFYPAGAPLINLIIYTMIILPFVVIKLIFTHPKFFSDFMGGHDVFILYKDFIFGPREIYALYWSRYISAFFGGFSVLLIYFLGKKLFNTRVALSAAFFLSFNYLQVTMSHYALPEIYNSFFSLLALYASVLLLEKNTRKRYIFASITASIALSMKYQAFALFPFLAVHIIWSFKKKKFIYLINKNFLLSAFVAVFIFFLINPYLLGNFREFLHEADRTYRWYQMGYLQLRGYPYFYLFHWGVGVLPFIVGIFGMIIMFLFDRRKLLLLFSFMVTILFVMTYYSNGGIYVRNFTSFVAFFLLFTAYFIDRLYRFTKFKFGYLFSLIVIFIFIMITNISSIRNSFMLSYSYAKPWNVFSLSDWLIEKIPQGVSIRQYQLFLPPKEMGALKEKKIAQKDWNYSKGPNSLAEFQEEGTDFAILNTSPLQSITYLWREWDDPRLFLQYGTVPFDFIENGFYGLSIKELMNYSVYEVYKPWQSYNEHNFIVFKIPTKPTDLGKRIAKFDFSKSEDLWKKKSVFPANYIDTGLSYDEGMVQKGALYIKLKKGNERNFERLTSLPIAVTPKKLYTVRGWIKNIPKGLPEERDGFLRVDFYKDKDSLDNMAISVAISQRAFATGEWEKVQASMRAPQNARYMTVSLQQKEALSFISYFDDIEVFETNNIPIETFHEVPYIKSTIPIESIYYNSFM